VSNCQCQVSQKAVAKQNEQRKLPRSVLMRSRRRNPREQRRQLFHWNGVHL
jgi:hypothetical protein